MSSEKYELLEEDMVSLLQESKDAIHHKLPGATGEEKRRLVRSIQKNLDEANGIMSDMDRELVSAPASYRLSMTTRLKESRREYGQLQAALNRLTTMMGTAAGRAEADAASREDSMRSQLFTGHQSLGRASESIARSHQIAAETEEIGGAVIDELGTQRDQLERTRDRLHGTDENLSKSRKILRSMGRRVITNKLLLIIIILVEAAILAGVVYYKFFRKKS